MIVPNASFDRLTPPRGWQVAVICVCRMARPQRKYTLDDDFTIEGASEIKHEFYNGEILAMAGASAAHNQITANVLSRLRLALRRDGCRAYGERFREVFPKPRAPITSRHCGSLRPFGRQTTEDRQ